MPRGPAKRRPLGDSGTDAGYAALERGAARRPEQAPLGARLTPDAHLEVASAAGADGLDRLELLVAVLDLHRLTGGAAGTHLAPHLHAGAAPGHPDRQPVGTEGRLGLAA